VKRRGRVKGAINLFIANPPVGSET